MHEDQLKRGWGSAAAAALFAAGVAWPVESRVASGLAAGAAWNLASLFCLHRLLRAWLAKPPSRRRVLLWFGLKFPLLYGLALSLFRASAPFLIGFGLGFTVVLLVMLGWALAQARLALTGGAHAR
jgi:hypothetical protein